MPHAAAEACGHGAGEAHTGRGPRPAVDGLAAPCLLRGEGVPPWCWRPPCEGVGREWPPSVSIRGRHGVTAGCSRPCRQEGARNNGGARPGAPPLCGALRACVPKRERAGRSRGVVASARQRARCRRLGVESGPIRSRVGVDPASCFALVPRLTQGEFGVGTSRAAEAVSLQQGASAQSRRRLQWEIKNELRPLIGARKTRRGPRGETSLFRERRTGLKLRTRGVAARALHQGGVATFGGE